jgi:L-lactate dehydrogenase complex protein LldE
MEIQLFIPCYIDQFYPQTAFNTISVLEEAGCVVRYNPKQTCCGQPAFNSGYWNDAAKLATKFLNDFDPELPVVSPSGSCTGYIKQHYHKLVEGNDLLSDRLKKIRSNIFELSDFLINKLKIESLNSCFPNKVTFHDSCSPLREYGIKDEPRKLLRMIKDLELIEMEESESCCGFGGTFSIKYPSISAAMTEKKVENALAAGVSYIVSTEASCLMNINGYISKHKLPIKGVHLADVLTIKVAQ